MVYKMAHRGASYYSPENTLRSFKKALELGVDMIELDVHICKTQEVVVMHDEKVERTTDSKGPVSEKTLEQLKILDAGKGEKIPLLTEVLDLVDRRCIVNIELKGPGTAKPVCDVIRNYVKEKAWKYDDFLVSSFEKPELEEFHKLNSEVPISVLYRKIPEDFANYAVRIGASFVALFYENATKKHIDEARKKGLEVIVWTIDEAEDIEKFKSFGVDYIGSNRPNMI